MYNEKIQKSKNNDFRLLRSSECQRISDEIRQYTTGGGLTSITIQGWWRGELRWARNRASLASDRRDAVVVVDRKPETFDRGIASTNQLDSLSLKSVVCSAERSARLNFDRVLPDFIVPAPTFETPQVSIWSDATYNMGATDRGRLVSSLTKAPEEKGMLSAGYLEILAAEFATTDEDGAVGYLTHTQAQLSLTVRHPQGAASGWAGLSSYDWSAIGAEALGSRAFDKCLASIEPVRIEPGRFTVILEPQAVAGLIGNLVQTFQRARAEEGKGPYSGGFDRSLGIWRSKLGLQIIDKRITLDHDPMNGQLGVLPHEGLRPVTWIRNGVLESLWYAHYRNFNDGRRASLRELNEGMPPSSFVAAYRMSGGQTSIDEMIATTSRGLLVTRFSNPILGLDSDSLLATGFTRDGLWLIEDGKISKAVKNMRFTESPLFVLNQVDQLGVPVPVFSPNPVQILPVIVPPIKSRDFSFTASTDAV